MAANFDCMCLSGRAKWLTVIGLSIATVAFMILFIVYCVKYHEKDQKDVCNSLERLQTDVCNSLECLQTASVISESIDRTVQPCDDFYQFSCNKWVESHPVSPSRPFRDNFETLRKELTVALRELLEPYNATAPDAIQKARAFYSSCLYTEKLALYDPFTQQKDKACLTGTGPWLNLFSYGGTSVFPTLDGDSWVDEDWTFSEMLARIPRRPNFQSEVITYDHPIIHFSVEVDVFNSDKYIIYFSHTRDYDEDGEKMLGDRNSTFLTYREEDYLTYLSSLGASPATAEQDARDVVDLEIRIAQSITYENATYQNMTIKQLTEKYPQFDWLGHVQREMSSVGINVTMNEEVMVDAHDYFDKIFDVISSTPRRTILNYCWWTVIQAYMYFAPTSSDMDRQDTCTTYTKLYFPEVVGRLYVDDHFTQLTKDKVEVLVTDLQNAFREILRGSDWMSEKTKQKAMEKIDAIVDKIGYSDDLKNDTYLDEKTKDVVINDNDVLASAVNVGERIYQNTLRRLRQRHNRLMWTKSATDVNAFYNSLTNSITLPAAILQKPVYRDTAVGALVYGGVGFFIGHEITHGFDNKGAEYDRDGNLNNWWHPEDLLQFEKRGDCMVQQYSNFSFPEVGMKVDGTLTLSENIADNGGLKQAYMAYKKMLARRGKEDPQLPVLGYSPEQLFFISTAQFWCVSQEKSQIRDRLGLYHTPHQFRVIGMMQNSVDFANAFNCPEGSYMNPERKCHVW